MTHITNALAQRVIELNNEAIASSMKGMRQDGVVTLQRALAMISTIQEAKVTIVSQRDSNSPSIGEASLACSVPLSRPQCSKPFDDVLDFFNRAITIPEFNDEQEDGFWCLTCPKTLSRFQSTLLYNLGVVCHMEAVSSGSSMAFGNALQFYGGAYQVLESGSRSQGFPNASLLVVLALFNNMGHIHSCWMMNNDKTRQCIAWMQSAFAMPGVGQVLDTQDYSFFSQYISVTASCQLLLSPAA